MHLIDSSFTWVFLSAKLAIIPGIICFWYCLNPSFPKDTANSSINFIIILTIFLLLSFKFSFMQLTNSFRPLDWILLLELIKIFSILFITSFLSVHFPSVNSLIILGVIFLLISTLGNTCSNKLLLIFPFELLLLGAITWIFSNFSSIDFIVDSFKSFNKGLILFPKKVYNEHKILVPLLRHWELVLFSKKQQNSIISLIGYKFIFSLIFNLDSSELFSWLGVIKLFIRTAPPFNIGTVLSLICFIKANITSLGDVFSIKFSNIFVNSTWIFLSLNLSAINFNKGE